MYIVVAQSHNQYSNIQQKHCNKQGCTNGGLPKQLVTEILNEPALFLTPC